jgi:hypothetical protein
VVIKELVDNALDKSGDCELVLRDGVVTVTDRGSGIDGDDEDIAWLFSISRPMASTKYLRLPTRGALGNGLRVVVGAVIAAGGKLLVSTRGRTLEVATDQASGFSEAIPVGDFDEPGTRIEIRLGAPLELTPDDLLMSEIAIAAARSQEKQYRGRSSPHWYNTDALHELALAIQDYNVTVRDFIVQFDGCSASAGKIAGGLAGRPARSLKRDEARELLSRAQAESKPVNPERLGAVGKDAFSGAYFRKEYNCEFPPGSDGSRINVPIVVEAWADPSTDGSTAVFMVNGTPCITDADAVYRSKEKVTIVYGPGLRLELKTGTSGVLLHVNIITPYMPVTGDGKTPVLGIFRTYLREVLERAVKRSIKMRPATDFKPNFKSVVFAHMEEQIKIVSDNRRYRFGWRQVFYRLRPIVEKAIGEPLKWNYFSQTLVIDYEEERGEERFAYRDPRGTFYSPHDGESFPLGTLQVERYRRPAWRYNSVLFLEKEGFFEALKAEGWPERHDCALMTSKGQPTRAARDLIDLIGDSDEPVQIFCLHDSDAAGTMIYQSLQEATRARPRRNIEVVNLGLDPWEASDLAEQGVVEVENVTYENRQPVADYVDEVDDEWGEWLQTHRVELNAFTTPQFIEWLDRKMSEHTGKLVPPDPVMVDRLGDQVRQQVRDSIMASVLSEARIEDRVNEAVTAMSGRIAGVVAELPARVSEDLRSNPQRHWAHVVDDLARQVTGGARESNRRP